jgi:hypothetical protein
VGEGGDEVSHHLLGCAPGTKGGSWPNLARQDGEHFNCGPGRRKARKMPLEDFYQAVEKELTGEEDELSEWVYFKTSRRDSRGVWLV